MIAYSTICLCGRNNPAVTPRYVNGHRLCAGCTHLAERRALARGGAASCAWYGQMLTEEIKELAR